MRARAIEASLTHSRGIALIAGLLLMASMVLLGLAVATGVLLERKMAGSFGDGQLALQRAQLASQWAGYWLHSQAEDPLGPDCGESCGSAPPIFGQGHLPAWPEHEDAAWWSIQGMAAGVEPGSGTVRMDYDLPGVESPRWLIEELHMEPIEGLSTDPDEPQATLGYYRILARGTGRQAGSIAVTETLMARPWAGSLSPTSYPPDQDAPWFCEQVPEDLPCGRTGWRKRR